MLSLFDGKELLADPRSISAKSKNGSFFSLTGDGISVMLTGSELPLNQLASFPGLVSPFPRGDFSPVNVCPNSAASSRETGSGEVERSLLSLRKGRNTEDLKGELDRLDGMIEAKPTMVLSR
jgi:hypothetical protein